VVGLACSAVRARQPELAARLFGCADAELERLGASLVPVNQVEYQRGVAALSAAIARPQLESARTAGRALTLEDAVELARALVRATTEHAAGPVTGPAACLTGREYEVAQLVSRGLSNRQVAAELVITEKTVKNHVQHVLEKLGVRSRTELAARAAAMGIRTQV
jgi:non-specific serine/threonine protein kinase